MRPRAEARTGRFHLEPPRLFAAPDDKLRFVPEGRLRVVKSIAGISPDGMRPWRGRMG
jgi:hypothetical protein